MSLSVVEFSFYLINLVLFASCVDVGALTQILEKKENVLMEGNKTQKPLEQPEFRIEAFTGPGSSEDNKPIDIRSKPTEVTPENSPTPSNELDNSNPDLTNLQPNLGLCPLFQSLKPLLAEMERIMKMHRFAQFSPFTPSSPPFDFVRFTPLSDIPLPRRRLAYNYDHRFTEWTPYDSPMSDEFNFEDRK